MVDKSTLAYVTIKVMEKIKIPHSAMKYFIETGRIGGETRAARYSKEQLREWGKLGGRPPGGRKRRKASAKKGGN